MKGFLRLLQCISLFVSLLVFSGAFPLFCVTPLSLYLRTFFRFFSFVLFPFFSSFVFPLFCFVFGFFRIGTTCFLLSFALFSCSFSIFLSFRASMFGLAKCPLLLRSRKSVSRRLTILQVYPLPESY